MEEQKQAEQQWNKIRRERINILKEAPSEENLWQAVMAFQDYPFKTVTGLPFQYTLKTGKNGEWTKELWIDRREKSKSLSWSSVVLAFKNSRKTTEIVKRPKALGDIRGISYIYPILWRLGLIRVPEKYMHTLLVTSAVAGEGKTTVACNLALGLEKKGYSVLLLDADLRKPAVCRTIQLDSGTEGAYEVLTGQRTAEEVKIRCRDTQLCVIAGTKSLSSTQQILGTGKIAEIIKQLEKEADLVIVDTPPAGILSDAAMLASCVDGGVFVVRQDFADVRILTEGIRELSEAGMEFAGCILNQTEHK